MGQLWWHKPGRGSQQGRELWRQKARQLAAGAIYLTNHTLPHPPPQRFNAWIDEQRAGSPQTGLAVYPEVRAEVERCLCSSEAVDAFS